MSTPYEVKRFCCGNRTGDYAAGDHKACNIAFYTSLFPAKASIPNPISANKCGNDNLIAAKYHSAPFTHFASAGCC